MPDATITSTASTFGTITGTFAADQSTVTGTITGTVAGTLTGSVGVPGPAGPGVPAGGTAGQYLQKTTTGVDYATDWVTLNLSAYAPLNSPAFTGDPTAPTAALGDNDTSLATTAFVQQELASGVAVAKNLEVYVRNQTGSTIPAGSIVYISGATGNRPLITLAQANNDANSAQTMGFTKTAIANNGFGFVIVRGELENIDTSALTEGAQLYLSPTVAGTWTTTKPSAPQHLVYVGIVVRAHPTQGIILVAVQNGYELNELHDVAITSPTNGQVLKYNSSTNLWVNDTDVGGVAWGGITGTLSSQTDLQTALDGKYSTSNPAGYITSSALSPYLLSSTAASTYYLQTNPAGYITSAALTGYATESFVTSQGYITSAALTPYLTKADNLGSLTNFSTARDNLGLGTLSGPTFASLTIQGSGANVANLTPTSLSLTHATSGTFTIQPSVGITFPDATVQTTAYTGAAPGYITSVSSPLSVSSGNLTIDLSAYLTSATAASTYQTLAGMSSYLTTASAASTYLTQSNAASTYQTLSGMSSYLTTSSAASTYQTIAGMSSYLTTSTAASTYALKTDGALKGNFTLDGTAASPNSDGSILIGSSSTGYSYLNLQAGVIQGVTYSGGNKSFTLNGLEGLKLFSSGQGVRFPDATTQTTAYPGPSGFLLKADNLSGLASTSTARTNLGLGTMATATAADYSTTTVANGLYYPLSSNPAGYLTSAPVTSVAGKTGAVTLVVGDVSGAAALAGATFTGLVGTVASATTGAGLNIPHGAAPTTPVNGDVWTTTSGLFMRQNGVTKQYVDFDTSQTINGNKTFSNATSTFGSSTATGTISLASGATISGSTKTVNIGTAGVAGSTTNITAGPVLGASTITIGATTAASTLNLATGATLTATTKAVNIGTAGVAGSTTNIAIGSTTGTSTTTLNGTVNATTASPGTNTTQIATTAFVTAAVPAFATEAEIYSPSITNKVISPFDAVRMITNRALFDTMASTGSFNTSGTGAEAYKATNDRLIGLGTPNAGIAGHGQHMFDTTAGSWGILASKRGSLQYSQDWSKKVFASGTAMFYAIGDSATTTRVMIGGRAAYGTGSPTKESIGWKLVGGGSNALVLVTYGFNGTSSVVTETTSSFTPVLNQAFDWFLYHEPNVSTPSLSKCYLYVNDTLVATGVNSPSTATVNFNYFLQGCESTGSHATRMAYWAFPTKIWWSRS
jgi:hypothetical protein